MFRSVTAFCILVATGCGRGGPEFAPASGIVLMDGKPVDNAGVLFHPLGEGPMSSGTTDAQGRFRLTSSGRDGALVGEHEVSIDKVDHWGEGVDPKILQDPKAYRKGLIRLKPKLYLPAKYGNRETSGLRATVESSTDNEFKFDLAEKAGGNS